MDAVGILLSTTPVLVFLILLILMDSFKLVPLRSVVQAVLVGCLVAGICVLLNTGILETFGMNPRVFRRYVAPITEELAKSIYVIFLMRTQRIGFLVDAVIYGFAVGTGFALVENVVYLHLLGHASILTWIVRGFGTALIHGSATAIFATLSKSLTERHPSRLIRPFVPGLLTAVAIHSLYNHFAFPPLVTTAGLLVVLPLLVIVVFERSDKVTRNWLGTSFDNDLELLELIMTGDVRQSRIGTYLDTLRHKFPPAVVADILCFLRIHVELSMRAKGQLIAREAGVELDLGEEVQANFVELEYLGKTIGPTGKLVIHPFLRTSSRDLWQMYALRRRPGLASLVTRFRRAAPTLRSGR